MTFLDWLKSLFGTKPPVPPIPPGPDTLARLITLHNQYRATRGKPPMIANPFLMSSASRHATDMATHHFLSHTGSDGSSPFMRMTLAGYQWSNASENIAQGQTTADQVMRDWEADPPHRAGILGPYQHIGVARAGDYWVADFASPK